jgi:dipeptidyl aminopeptidase/acylaminoacyl peptidase
MTADPPPLPDRAPEVTAGLPYPFRRSQLDGGPPAFALTPAGPVVSTDAWSGRQLALWDGTAWTRLTTTPGWHTGPKWTDEGLVADCYEDLAAERHVTRPVPWGYERESFAPAGPDAVLLRRARARRVVSTSNESLLDAPVTALGSRLSPDELVVIVERWPARLPHVWHTRTGDLRPLVDAPSAVVDHVQRVNGAVAFSWTTPEQPRRLTIVPLATLHAGRPVTLTPDTPAGEVPPPARPVVVEGPACPLPCLVSDPATPCRGTIVLLHGGPNGAHAGTWSPLAQSLVLRGWRVVQPNIRGSLVLDPPLPIPRSYGADDAEDVATVIDQLAEGEVVVGGVSYGGYLATRTAHLSRRVQAVFVLCGFLHRTNLKYSEYEPLRRFLKATAGRFAPDRPLARVPHFVAHGARDPRIPVKALLVAHLPNGSTTVVVRTEGHGIVTDHAACTVFPRLFDWLDYL